MLLDVIPNRKNRSSQDTIPLPHYRELREEAKPDARSYPSNAGARRHCRNQPEMQCPSLHQA